MDRDALHTDKHVAPNWDNHDMSQFTFFWKRLLNM